MDPYDQKNNGVGSGAETQKQPVFSKSLRIRPFATLADEPEGVAVQDSFSQPDLSKIRRLAAPVFDYFFAGDGFIFAGFIAFSTIFAFFPFLILILSLAGFWGWGEAAANLIEIGLEILPQEVAAVLGPVTGELRTGPHGTVLTFSMLFTLWFSSSGLEALRYALNVIHEVENPASFWSNRLKSIAMTIFAATFFLMAMFILIGFPLAKQIISWTSQVDLLDYNLTALIRYVIGMILVMIVTFSFHLMLPNRSLKLADIWPGALVSVVLWVSMAALYSVYLSSFGRYSIVYGSLGGVIITLFFFYCSAVIFLLGGIVNRSLEKERQYQLNMRL